MSTFEVPVLRVDDVYDHPNADRLSIVKIRGYEAITNKLEDGSHRYAKGALIVYVPEFAVVPAEVLKERGYWDDEKDEGMLAGKGGCRVKAIRLRGVLSQGLVWKTEEGVDEITFASTRPYIKNSFVKQSISEGDNVADFFGIVKYEEPIPASMSGDVISLVEARFDYDIENLKNYPNFLSNDEVVVTEKLHGTFVRMSYFRDITPNPDLFGDGRVVIASKGLGSRGIVFKNTEDNAKQNIYVRTMIQYVDDFADYCRFEFADAPVVHMMGEIFGPGIQDLHYGVKTAEFKVFDFHLYDKFADNDLVDFIVTMGLINVKRVPILYRGPFNSELFDELRSGKTTLGEGNIREGIVITAIGSQDKRQADAIHQFRPILKHVSDEYLTRKGGTELQ